MSFDDIIKDGGIKENELWFAQAGLDRGKMKPIPDPIEIKDDSPELKGLLENIEKAKQNVYLECGIDEAMPGADHTVKTEIELDSEYDEEMEKLRIEIYQLQSALDDQDGYVKELQATNEALINTNKTYVEKSLEKEKDHKTMIELLQQAIHELNTSLSTLTEAYYKEIGELNEEKCDNNEKIMALAGYEYDIERLTDFMSRNFPQYAGRNSVDIAIELIEIFILDKHI